MPCSATRCGATLIFAPVQNAAVHLGMKRLYPAIEHLGKTGQIGDVFHFDAGIAQQFGRAAGRDQFDSHAGEFAGELHQAGLIGDAENGTLNSGGMRSLKMSKL